MQSSAANHMTSGFDDGEIAHVFANLSETARQEHAAFRESGNDLVDAAGIREPGLTRAHRLLSPPPDAGGLAPAPRLHVQAPCRPGRRGWQEPPLTKGGGKRLQQNSDRWPVAP